MPSVSCGNIELYYEEYGQGVPVVLVSGLGNDCRMWSMQVEKLSRAYRVIIFDNRGVGQSDKPEGPYSTKQMAEDTAFLISALDLSPVHLIGFSMGGLIGQWVSINYPEKVRSLTLIACYGKGGNFGVQIGKVWREIANRAGMDLLIKEKALWIFSRHYIDHRSKEFKWMQSLYGKTPPPVHSYVAQNLACSHHDASDWLKHIQVPCLIIASSQDRITSPEYIVYLHENIKNSQLVWAEEGGHGLLWECPETVNEMISHFLVTVSPEPLTKVTSTTTTGMEDL